MLKRLVDVSLDLRLVKMSEQTVNISYREKNFTCGEHLESGCWAMSGVCGGLRRFWPLVALATSDALAKHPLLLYSRYKLGKVRPSWILIM